MRTLPLNGNDALAHDARRIRFGDLRESTTVFSVAGNLQWVAHFLFLFVNCKMNALYFAQNSGAKQRIHLFFKIRISSQSCLANSSATQSYAHGADRAQGQRWIG
jgi:hypothetical protein